LDARGLLIPGPVRMAAQSNGRGQSWAGKLAEVLVIGVQRHPLEAFLRSACDAVEFEGEQVLIGRRDIRGFRLRIYAVLFPPGAAELSRLDLIAERALGGILLYPWEPSGDQTRAEELVDRYDRHAEGPLLIAAYGPSGSPLPRVGTGTGLRVGDKARLVGMDLRDPQSALRVLLDLLSLAAERAPE